MAIIGYYPVAFPAMILPGPHVHTSSETVPQGHWWDRELLKWCLVLLEKVSQKSVGQDL